MTARRLGAAAGLGFVVCFAVAAVLYGSGAGSDPAGIAAYYASRAHRLRQIEGFAVLLAGCALLLVFVAALRAVAAPAGTAAALVLAGGSAAAAMLAASNALWAASAFAVELEEGYRIDPRTHLALEDAGFAALVTAAALAIPFVLAASFAAVATGVFPRWFAGLGALAALGLAGAYWYWPLAAFLLWVAAASVLLSRPAPHDRRGRG